MLNVKGKTAVYLMYAYARCKSIMNKINNLEEILDDDIDIKIENIESKYLLLHVLNYYEVIKNTLKDLCPHYICDYLYNLSTLLTKFYDKNKCIDLISINNIIKIYTNRIKIVFIVINIMQKLFELVGLEYIDQIYFIKNL